MRILDIISNESLEAMLYERQGGLCPICGDALDEETKIIKNHNPQTLNDYRLVCRGYCQLNAKIPGSHKNQIGN
uniref:Uncharacterized protein n=1 Tax=viral metagenome TaxID=1070528 RepID=A0A6M3JXA6_9ZZZZ